MSTLMSARHYSLRTCAAMSATFTMRHAVTTGQRHVRGLITIVRSYDNRTVSVHDLMSARRYPAPHPRRRVRDVHNGVMRPTSCS